MSSLRLNKGEQQHPSLDSEMTQTNLEGVSLLQRSAEWRLSNFSCSSAMMIHNQTLVARLASRDVRLPPNYVGVRKVRPGIVNSASKRMMACPISLTREPQESRTTTTTNQPEAKSDAKKHDAIRTASSGVVGVVVFKVVGDDGKERRMTKQEKKEKKRQRALEEKETKKRTKLERRRQLKCNQQQVELHDEEQDLSLKRKRQEDIEGSELFQESLDEIPQSDVLRSSPTEEMSRNPSTRSSSDPKSSSYNNYHELQVDPNQLEEEWADYHVDRRSIPPVILSPPMAWVAGAMLNSGGEVVRTHQTLMKQKPTVHDSIMLEEEVKPSGMEEGTDERDGISANNSRKGSHNMAWIQYDPEISLKWAQSLKATMSEAESARDAEDMRPMAYQLVPEPWTRHRGGSLNNGSNSSQHHQHRLLALMPCGAVPAGIRPSHEKLDAPDSDEMIDDGMPSSRDWSMVSLRPASSKTSFDSDLSIVLEYIHRDTPFYVSCGGKFGCDFLLYDGPRHERHAFAGLRILATSSAVSSHLIDRLQAERSKKKSAQRGAAVFEPASDYPNAACKVTDDFNFPLPTAYSMSGYVRGLNTAGKLALVATVVRDVVAGENEVGAGNPDGARCTSVDDSRQPNLGSSHAVSVYYRVAIVDLALEKVLSAPTHQRRRNHGHGTVALRREVGQHLAKK